MFKWISLPQQCIDPTNPMFPFLILHCMQLQPEPVPGLSLFLSPTLARTHRYLERERRRSPERAPPSILWVLRGPSTSINTIAVAPPFFSLRFILSLLHFNSSFSTFFFLPIFSSLLYIYHQYHCLALASLSNGFYMWAPIFRCSSNFMLTLKKFKTLPFYIMFPHPPANFYCFISFYPHHVAIFIFVCVWTLNSDRFLIFLICSLQ